MKPRSILHRLLDPDCIPESGELPRKVAVGVAELVDVVTRHSSPWFKGPYGLVLSRVSPLPEPIPMSGRQKLWRVE